jgi:amidohydrolase
LLSIGHSVTAKAENGMNLSQSISWPLTPFHEWLVELRRCFHQYPELAFQERLTAAKIAEVLHELGVPFETGIAGTGVVARLEAHTPGPALGMRADMDALPLNEDADVPYRSKHPGVMHACGHDGHITVALGVVRWLVENGWRESGRGRILFFFQPAEEAGGGARAMIETGILDAEPVEAIFAGHMHPELPAGHIGVAPDVCNASSNTVRIRIRGRGGHGAQPQFCRDPIVAGAYLVTQLQSIISRNVHPLENAVLTIGRFHAGTAPNIIPEEAALDGTLRALRPEIKELVEARISEMLKGLEASHQVSTELVVRPGYPVLVNDSHLATFCMERAKELLGDERVHKERPRMGAEDFSYFLQRSPGLMVRLGCHDPEKGFVYGLHSPHFELDERALDVGVRLFVELLTGYESWKERSSPGSTPMS